ncbi:MAG: IS6 family transposase [Chloroflexi bacterium]|nr:IS6 family transposase [Chloroflexota bacterium]
MGVLVPRIILAYEPVSPESFPPWFDSEIFPGVTVRLKSKRVRLLSRREQVRLHPLFHQAPIPPDVRCKGCESQRLQRFGKYNNVQRYRCLDCGITFMDNKALRYMKVSIPAVADAVSLFYEGLSLAAIQRQLRQTYGIYPSDSNVYAWVVRFTKQAASAAEGMTAHVGNVWVADETVLKIGGENVWFWDLIDERTRFLLASHLTPSRFTTDAQTLMERAAERAGKVPRVVVTDKLRAYLDGVEKTFGANTLHVQSRGFTIQPNTNLIERFHGTLKGRAKVMRGLKKRETARLFLGGWLIYYNYFRPHEALRNKTPGEVARVSFPYRGWADVVRSETFE